MFELLTLFLTGGGSAAMGSILKGVFGASHGCSFAEA